MALTTKQPSRQNFVPSFLCCSINENEDGGVLCGFDDILKLLIRRVGRFELGMVAVRKDSGTDSRKLKSRLLLTA